MRLTYPIAAFALATALPLSAQADVVTDWNKNAVDEIRKLGLGPNPATRTLAITQIAVYDAVNAITGTHQPYHASITSTLPASLEAAAASAAYQALVLQFPNEKGTLDGLFTQSLSAIADGPAKQHGIEIGKAAAVDIYTLRIGDGSTATSTYPGSTDVGKWRPTPRADVAAAPLPALEPWWRYVTPFGLTSPSQFRPDAPPAITSAAFSTAYKETKSLGKIDSTTRTADQTQIANFWKQATHVPFNAIARSISKVKELTVEQNARLFALLNITLADTRIAVWDAKYQYGFWRPITAINTDTDYGALDAPPDTTWVPLIETPNHPEYPSGHSITGGGGARLLAQVFGDDVSFAVVSDTLPGVTRSFTKLSDAEQENANSRIYGGLHYRFSNETGIDLGHKVADYVFGNYLKALPGPIGEGGAGGEDGVGSAGEANTAGSSSSAGGGAGGTGGTSPAGAAGETESAEAGEGGVSPTGGKGGSGGGGAGKPAVPALSAEDDEDSSCAVAQPGRASDAFGVGLLLAAVGVGLRLRRRRSQR
ncbi:MAG: vanadium-dependent haloperoxidase [Myxococcales bacterium]